MKFFAVITSLAALAVASPAAESLNHVAPRATETTLIARQTFPGCGGLSPGQYGCWITIADPNDRYSYIGVCGTDGNTYVSVEFTLCV